MNAITAIDLSKTYQVDQREITVLDHVSLSAEQGEFVVVAGKSGSGKTTLLTLLSGLDKPTSGRILIGGQDITDWPENDLAPLRNQTFGFVFQSYYLVPSLTAIENVMFPAQLNGGGRDPVKAAQALLARVGLSHRAGNFPHQLSGGEKQRVAICRALINQPQIVFADEPTGNLDSQNGQDVLDLLLELRKLQNTTLILVTHNPDITGSADRVVQLLDGRTCR